MEKTIHKWLIFSLLFVFSLTILHIFFSDFELAGMRFFNLDKERNLPTWFSGMIFAGIGMSTILVFVFESAHEHRAVFRLPQLWLGLACIAFFMSMDEMIILHENLFWREVRLASDSAHPAFKFLTQWQLLFAPAILAALAYFALLFVNRYRVSQVAMRNALIGIAF